MSELYFKGVTTDFIVNPPTYAFNVYADNGLGFRFILLNVRLQYNQRAFKLPLTSFTLLKGLRTATPQ